MLEQDSRDGFVKQMQGLSRIGGEASIVVRVGTDLARAALQIAAEDDSLISHSSVPLPVDSFVERLDDLSMEFCSLYMPPLKSPPEVFIGNLERYFYVHKVTYSKRRKLRKQCRRSSACLARSNSAFLQTNKQAS